MLNKGPYNPNDVENEMLRFWIENKFFKPEYHKSKGLQTFEEMKNDGRETFCIVNPPPNAYMRPHVGNVSGYAYQDVFLRFNRMLGKKVLGQPGKDHAGIQGEVVLEKLFVNNEGKSKKDLGREEFYKKAYRHFIDIMPNIMSDEQRIGLSSDYDRNLFTLDPRVVDTVLGTFFKMFNDGMVYKGVRIVNYDIVAKTTLADIDTERLERETDLVYIKYPLIRQRAWYLSMYDLNILESIKNNIKTIETRALNPEEPERYFKDIKEGDLIVFVDKSENGINHVYKKAEKIQLYSNLNDLFSNSNLEQICSKKVNSVEELRDEYNKMSENYASKIDNNGVVAITLSDLSEQDYITVATTRAETMLADTAVTVNPSDDRFNDIKDKKVIIPLVNREVRIITSIRVDKEFGTGAVKLTPAHSYDDYTIMNEWNSSNSDKTIGYINIINKEGEMTGPIPLKYKGIKTDFCREIVINDLKELVVKKERIKQSIMIGERSKAIIEQIMSSQWFLDVEKLKGPAIKAVENGEVRIHPSYMTKKYLIWMNNLRDWPVSRSLWWGYRIPVWYKGEIDEIIDENGQIVETINGEKVIDINDAVNKGVAKVQIEKPGEEWIQDKDVFDTWFSSGQWPYATLKANNLIDIFYPTQVMETAYDILELWVSRMIMLGIYHEGKPPFNDVYLHGLVKAPDGQKMSKSKNNVIEPDLLINKYGADSLRLLYLVGNKAGAGYPVSYEKLEGYKRFLNKIWNASKFVLSFTKDFNINLKPELINIDRNIINDFLNLSKKTKNHIEKYRLGIAAEEIYQEFWHSFCDKYIEEVKPRIYSRGKDGNDINTSKSEQESMASAKYTLLFLLKGYLKILHPFIPFITEKIWQEIPKANNESVTIMYEDWPL